MTTCARAHTNHPRLVQSKIPQKGASKEVSLEQNKTCILLREGLGILLKTPVLHSLSSLGKKKKEKIFRRKKIWLVSTKPQKSINVGKGQSLTKGGNEKKTTSKIKVWKGSCFDKSSESVAML